MRRLISSVRPGPILAVGWVLTACILFIPLGVLNDVVYLLVTAIGALAAWTAVPLVRACVRPVARLIAVGLTMSGLADLAWTAISWSGGDPDSSIADLYYLAGYVLLGSAIVVALMPVRDRRRIVDTNAVIDILTVVTVTVLVLWELVLRDSFATEPLREVLTRSEVVYPLVDAVLIGLVLRAMADRTTRSMLGLGFGLGTVCWMLGDFAYLQREVGALTQNIMSATWMVGTLLIATSVRRMSRPTRSNPTRDETTAATTRLLLTVATLSVPPILAFVEEVRTRQISSWALLGAMVVLIGLNFLRTERLLASERRIRRELAATRDAALSASRAKSTFLASISHEIRTPMNGVLGLSRLLASGDLDEEQRQYAEGIQRAGESLMELLNDVLDFAKLEEGRILVDATDFDVVTIVEDVAAMVAEQAHQQGVELIAHCSPTLPRGLNGDPTKLRQVLLNFAANAVSFTSVGEVVVRACVEREVGDQVLVRFEVRDTGVGIAEEDQDRLFEAFTQVEQVRPNARRQGYGGTGLGLAIAKSLVDAMGGQIGVDSLPGRGSTFWCVVPLMRAREQQVVETRPSRARAGTRVLVVDDNATSRAVLTELLGAWHLDVDSVSGGHEALDALAVAAATGSPYSLVMVDLLMPGMGGLELAERIRAAPTAGCTPIAILSSGPDVPAPRLRRAGVSVTVSKPLRLARLQSAVQRSLGVTASMAVSGATELAPMGRGVVLVVEDSEVNQLVAVGTLRQLGYLTEVACDGAQAVSMVALNNYDAVLMDCRMPVMDGYEAAAEIRRNETGHRVPIIAVTANASASDRERTRAAGMDDYLVKPLGRQHLASALARWVSVGTGVG